MVEIFVGAVSWVRSRLLFIVICETQGKSSLIVEELNLLAFDWLNLLAFELIDFSCLCLIGCLLLVD